jgi:hypothetical protein
MKIFNDIRIYIVITLLSLIWAINQTIIRTKEIDDLKKEVGLLNHTIKKLESQKDSLYWEVFPAQVELGRYQVAYDIFMERNPKAAEQYGTIISEETE